MRGNPHLGLGHPRFCLFAKPRELSKSHICSLKMKPGATVGCRLQALWGRDERSRGGQGQGRQLIRQRKQQRPWGLWEGTKHCKGKCGKALKRGQDWVDPS